MVVSGDGVDSVSPSVHLTFCDDHKLSPVLLEFGIPQGSILGPTFNLYVADLQDILPPTAKSFQYANDATIIIL